MSIVAVGDNGYDERQVLLRGKISNACLAGVLATVLVNGAVNDAFGPWGPALLQASVVASVWMTVFVVWAMGTGAYFGSGGPASRARLGYLLAAVGAVAAAVQGWRLWGSPERWGTRACCRRRARRPQPARAARGQPDGKGRIVSRGDGGGCSWVTFLYVVS